MSALKALQEAVDAKLIADARFTGRVFDDVTQGTNGWYVVIGDATERPFGAHDNWGREITLILHVFSEADGMWEAQEIVGYLNDLLDRKSLTVAGWGLVGIQFEFAETLREAEWRHIPVRYRVRLKQGA